MDQTTAAAESSKIRLPIAGSPRSSRTALDLEIERELRLYEEAERERLGLLAERRHWVDTMLEPKMTRKERDRVTLLISGLTAAHDFLSEGALRGLGYKVQYIGMSDNAALATGKEFGNRGQCNPTYFTVGTLVKHLIELRDVHGLSAEEIVKNYVFVTAGACGPCRFGMYVTEYRKALRDAGFEGFRVMLFQQTGGLSQATGEDVGLQLDATFFTAVVKAIVCGDVLNALAYRIRPYEVEPGATNRAMEAAKRILYQALYERTNIFSALYRARKEFAKVRVDKLRPKAKTAIIGEFWAMTTEGDGNYQLQKFIESEGGECDIQLTTAWLLYNIWQVSRDTRERMNLREADGGRKGLENLGEFGVARRLATMRLAEALLRAGFSAFAVPIGLFDYHLPDMEEIAKVADAHYSNDLRGGEGHMEVGKLIVNAIHSKSHITISVKPFGCMPSSGVSDGVQSLIQARYPGTIFCAVETSGDGAANFYSRVQMYMFKARIAAEQELARAYEECGVTPEQVRAFLDANPEYASPFHHAPHRVAGSAANLVYEVAPLIKQTWAERASKRARETAKELGHLLASTPERLRAAYRFATDPETFERVRVDAALVADLVRGKGQEHILPLIEKVAGRALFGEAANETARTEAEPIAAE